MVEKKKLGWIFSADGVDGIPHLTCPYCGRVVGGKKWLFADKVLTTCPGCGKEAHLDNVKEEDWLYINSYYERSV